MSELSQSIHLKNTPVGDLPDDWSFAPISNVVKDSKKVTYGIVQPGSYTDTGVLLIRGQDYIKGWASEEKFFRVALPLHRLYKRSTTVAGDVLLCIVGATTGAVNVVPEWITEANITQTTARISCESGKVDPSFVFYVLASETGQAQVRKYVKGSAQPGLNLADVERFYVPLPPLPQQRKIARILTTVDNLIEQTEALIEKYKSIKQGMMHDLFTRGVDQSGRLRPPYEDAPELYKESPLGWIPKEWDCVKTGDHLSRIEQGWSPDCESHPAGIGEWGVLKTTAVVWEGYCDDANKRLPSHLSPRREYEVRRGDVLMTRGGPNSRVGVVSFVESTHGKRMMSDKLYRLVPHKSLSSRFLSLALSSAHTQIHLSTLKTGLAESQTNISQAIVRRLMIPLPSADEQHAIEGLASNIQTLIHRYHEDFSKTERLKSGLMQDLLTGKVRVNVDEVEESNHPTESVSCGVGL
jgi:type I restriction enzyme, S subunit